MAYIMIRFPKKEIFDSLHKQFLEGGFPKKEILIDYIIRLYDFLKMKIER